MRSNHDIGAKAHGERTVSTKQPWQTWPPLTVGLPVTSERYWASFQDSRLFHEAFFSQCDHLLLLHVYLLFETSPGWLPGWRAVFLARFGGGALSSNVFTICAEYWSLGRRGCFGVLNVALVYFIIKPIGLYSVSMHCHVFKDIHSMFISQYSCLDAKAYHRWDDWTASKHIFVHNGYGSSLDSLY